MSFISPYSKKDVIKRQLWSACWFLFARPIPRNLCCGWKRYLLRLWGAKIADNAIIYSNCRIFAPWNLIMESNSCIASDTDIYNAAEVILKEGAIVSQYTYLCTATHDIRDVDFQLYSKPIVLERSSWVAAKCFIGPGVTIGEGAVVGASASVYKDVPAWTVVGGNPAKIINKREYAKV